MKYGQYQFILLYKTPDRENGVLLLSNLPYNNDPNDRSMYCPHPYSLHFSDDVHALSKDKDVHMECTSYINPNGSECSCQGFKSSLITT